jgi:FemAB-related protein (PEP-CTERM system-associated)
LIESPPSPAACLAPAEVESLDEGSRAAWDRFVREQRAASGYQLWGWTDLIRDALKLEVHRLAALRDGELVGILPLVRQRLWPLGATLISLPFVNYAGLVATDAEAEARLLDAAVELAGRRGAGRIELRHTAPRAGGWGQRSDKVRFRIDTSTGEEAMWAALPGQRRTQIRRARKDGLVEIAGGAELLDDFYDVVALKWRDLGSPVLPRSFFAAVLERFPDDTRICLVRAGAVTAAAGMLYRFRDGAENPWVGSLDAFTKSRANVLLYWGMMVESHELGAASLDFGRSSRASGNYTFKSRWHAVEEELPWSVWPAAAVDGAESGPAAGLVKSVWKRLPLAVANRLGPWLSPNLPL